MATLSVTENGDGEIAVVMDGEGSDALIGRDGAVIDALQYLAHQTALRAGDGEPRRGDGRRGRVPGAAAAAAGAPRRARRERGREHSEEIELDPMTPHDRRIVHMALADRTDIVTRSEGDEPNRRIVVLPADRSPTEASRTVSRETSGSPCFT